MKSSFRLPHFGFSNLKNFTDFISILRIKRIIVSTQIIFYSEEEGGCVEELLENRKMCSRTFCLSIHYPFQAEKRLKSFNWRVDIEKS